MKSASLFLLVFSLVLNTGFSDHPFHASITECNHNIESKSLEITIRLFTDDLSTTIGEEIEMSDKLSNEQNKKIKEYVLSHITIKDHKNKNLVIKYVGVEREFDITFAYLEILSFSIAESYEISQTVFFDQFDDQTNILNLNINTYTISDYFTSSKTTKTYVVK